MKELKRRLRYLKQNASSSDSAEIRYVSKLLRNKISKIDVKENVSCQSELNKSLELVLLSQNIWDGAECSPNI